MLEFKEGLVTWKTSRRVSQCPGVESGGSPCPQSPRSGYDPGRGA